jgi:Rieske Fe-S protein
MTQPTPGIHQSCVDCISRRAFMTRSALAAAAVLAACGDGQIGGTGGTSPTGPKQIKVSDFPALAAVGTIVIVDISRAVKRTAMSPPAFKAFDRACTHEGTAVDLSGSGFECSNHLSRFNNEGQVIQGPALTPLRQLTTSYDPATDMLTIG